METNKVIVLVVLVGVIAFLAGYLMLGGKETNFGGSEDDGGNTGGGVTPSDTPPSNNDLGNTTEGNVSDLFGDSGGVNPPELPDL